MPPTIYAHQGHGHPLQMVCVLVDSLPFVFPIKKQRQAALTDSNVSRRGRRSNSIGPNDHVLDGLGGVVSASKLQQHSAARFGIIGSAVRIIERDTE